MHMIFTLDSHDWFGPFMSDIGAHAFARKRGLLSYTIVSWQSFLHDRNLFISEIIHGA
jgi:hypothetical protein